jgi:hypothetical protein
MFLTKTFEKATFKSLPGEVLLLLEEFLTPSEDIDQAKIPSFALSNKVSYSKFVSTKIESY